MSLVDAIAAVRNRKDLDEDKRRRDIYALKVNALVDVIEVGKTYGRARIEAVRMTPDHALFIDATFPSGRHQITIVNPPVLPAKPTGDERKDLVQALHEMLADFDR
jgi:hypothetical protein